MDKHGLKVGDFVKAIAPSNRHEAPGWTDGMDRYNGKIGEISRFTSNGAIINDFGGWYFNPKWLVKVDEEEESFDTEELSLIIG